MSLKLGPIHVSVDSVYRGRTDLRVVVRDASGVVQNNLTLTQGAENDGPGSADWYPTIDGVLIAFVPGTATFDFTGVTDTSFRPVVVDLAPYYAAAMVVQASPISPAGYPSGTDLSNALDTAGIVISVGVNLAATAIAAAKDFERMVGRVMVAPATYATRTFNPPTNPGGSLYVDDFVALATGAGARATATLTNGALSAVTLTAGGAGYPTAPLVQVTGGDPAVPATVTAQTVGGVVTGFTVTNAGAGYQSPPIINVLTGVSYAPYSQQLFEFVQGRDYGIEPATAPGYGFPYDRIDLYPSCRQFIQPIRSTLRRSILVTAQWGFASVMPQNAWDAMVARALWRLTPAAAQLGNKGILSWGHDGSEARLDPGFKTFAEQQDKIFREGVTMYRKAIWSSNG